MIFKKFSISNLKGCITTSSIILEENDIKVKISKGTIIDNKTIELLKVNNISELYCVKLDKNEITENLAAKNISKNLIAKNSKNLDFRNFSTGRSNIVAKNDGIFHYDEEQLFKINSLSNLIGIGALKPYSRVIKGQNLVSTKIISYGMPKELVSKIICAGKNCFKLPPFKKFKIHLIQTFKNDTKTKILDKISLITEERVKKYGDNSLTEFRSFHDKQSLNNVLIKSLSNNPDLILIFGIHAITDVEDLIPKVIKNNKGKILRFGMPVEPGNLILISEITKKNNKQIFVIGMPSCAKSPKENGVDWILWRVLSGLEINNNIINKMSIGGLIK